MAYLYRLACCNNSSFNGLIQKVQDELLIAGKLDTNYWIKDIATEHLRASLGPLKKRLNRWVCSACVEAGLPDVFVTDENTYLEFCLVHGTLPIKTCPSCKKAAKYGFGTYQKCKCGHEWGNTKSHKIKGETYRIYRQIASDIPLGVEPTLEDLVRHPLPAIAQRLQQTWELLWTDNVLDTFVAFSSAKDSIPFGKRWEILTRAMGADQYKLSSWIHHISCWLRSTGHSITESMMQRNVPWTYLRQSITVSYHNGCSGPRPSECVLVGSLCKSNKKSINGDLPPRLAGTFFRPVRRLNERNVSSEIIDTRPDPFGDEDSESLQELANGEQKFCVALIELVAMGVIQPLELTHPTTWRFSKGAVYEIFRHWIEKPELHEQTCHSINTQTLGEFCRYSSMGELIYRIFVTKELHLTKGAGTLWKAQLVNVASCVENNRWPLEAIHHAVYKSLSAPAKKAATVALGYLTATFADIELELYCGAQGCFEDPRSSLPKTWVRIEYENPSIAEAVWHRGKLVVL